MQILEATADTEQAAYVGVAMIAFECILLILTFTLVCARFIKAASASPKPRHLDDRAISIDLSRIKGNDNLYFACFIGMLKTMVHVLRAKPNG